MIHEEKLNQLCLFILQKHGLSRERIIVFKYAKTHHKDGKVRNCYTQTQGINGFEQHLEKNSLRIRENLPNI